MIHKGFMVVVALLVMGGLSGCQTGAEQIEDRAKTVRACVANDGEWYPEVSGGVAYCHFDTREDK